MSRILIIEDELSIAELERDYLELNDFEVEIETNGAKGLDKALENDYSLILLDLMLPDLDGFEICRQIREKKDIPIIMVTAKKNDIDKIRGLGLGVDDYVTKPFSIIELVARIKANIRRATKYINVSHEEEIIQIKDLKIYTDQHKVERGGKIINLTHTEFEILVLLASNPGRAFSKEEMYLKIWNEPYYGNERVLNSHMNRLRGKLNIDNSNKMDYIQTLWGIGYKMEK